MVSGFQVLDSRSFSVEMGFRIPVVSGSLDSCSSVFRISRSRIPDATGKNFQDSRFHMQNFPGFRNPDSLHGANFAVCYRFLLKQAIQKLVAEIQLRT